MPIDKNNKGADKLEHPRIRISVCVIFAELPLLIGFLNEHDLVKLKFLRLLGKLKQVFSLQDYLKEICTTS